MTTWKALHRLVLAFAVSWWRHRKALEKLI